MYRYLPDSQGNVATAGRPTKRPLGGRDLTLSLGSTSCHTVDKHPWLGLIESPFESSPRLIDDWTGRCRMG